MFEKEIEKLSKERERKRNRRTKEEICRDAALTIIQIYHALVRGKIANQMPEGLQSKLFEDTRLLRTGNYRESEALAEAAQTDALAFMVESTNAALQGIMKAAEAKGVDVNTLIA